MALLVIIAVVLVLTRFGSGPDDEASGSAASTTSTSTTSSASPSSSSSSSSSATSSSSPTLPDYTVTGEYQRMQSGTGVRGTKGDLYTYRVEVEKGTGIDVKEFARAVDKTLAHPRGWIGEGQFRFQRVTDEEPRMTIRLATPETVDEGCAEAGFDTEGFLSCRSGDDVLINLNRWAVGTKEIRNLDVYRPYLVNHEVGHILGFTHESCTGKGDPAPLMQQQTKGLDGCKANAWRYTADGSEITGPPAD